MIFLLDLKVSMRAVRIKSCCHDSCPIHAARGPRVCFIFARNLYLCFHPAFRIKHLVTKLWEKTANLLSWRVSCCPITCLQMLAPNNITNTEWKWPEVHNSWLICFKYERIKKRCAMDLFFHQWMGWWWWHIFVKSKTGVITIMLLSSLDNAFCTAFTPYNSVIIALWWIHLYQMRSLNIHHLTLANAGREEQRTGHRQCERET